MIPDIVIWIIIGIAGAGLLAALVTFLVKFFKMSREERKLLVVNFLVGLVTTAEGAYNEHGMGKEKVKMVEEAFNRTAPWFLKIVLTLTKTANLDELIEQALTEAKETWAKEKK